MVKVINTVETVTIPEGVKVSCRGRVVTVTGTRGTLTRSFKHLQCDIRIEKPLVKVEIWLGDKYHNCCARTVCSHLKNMFIGVTKGFQYNMRLVYAHFPINVAVVSDGKALEIRNFLGQKFERKVPMLEGVKIHRSEKVKDQIELTGNDIETVSQSAANIHQSVAVKKKDIRKFLDGIYVAEKGPIGSF